MNQAEQERRFLREISKQGLETTMQKLRPKIPHKTQNGTQPT